jgi:hypothetical protein
MGAGAGVVSMRARYFARLLSAELFLLKLDAVREFVASNSSTQPNTVFNLRLLIFRVTALISSNLISNTGCRLLQDLEQTRSGDPRPKDLSILVADANYIVLASTLQARHAGAQPQTGGDKNGRRPVSRQYQRFRGVGLCRSRLGRKWEPLQFWVVAAASDFIGAVQVRWPASLSFDLGLGLVLCGFSCGMQVNDKRQTVPRFLALQANLEAMAPLFPAGGSRAESSFCQCRERSRQFKIVGPRQQFPRKPLRAKL